MNDATIRRIEVTPGLGLEYAERGEGPAILFLHGYTDSWWSYERVLPLLPQGVRALALSQRGHGGSDRPGSDYRIERFAADAAAFLDAVGVSRATVVGHSMGSLIARELALTYPERVSRLVLIGSVPTFDIAVVRELLQAVQELSDPVPRDFAYEFQASCVHRPPAGGLLDRMTEASLEVPARVWREALAGCVDDRTETRLGELSVPTLIVGGDRDALCAPAEQLRLRAAIPGSTLLLYEETGHCPQWEQPQRFVDDLLAFVRRDSARTTETPLTA